MRLAGLLALVVTAFLALSVGSASALTTRQLKSQITKANGTAFANPFGLAVDNPDLVLA